MKIHPCSRLVLRIIDRFCFLAERLSSTLAVQSRFAGGFQFRRCPCYVRRAIVIGFATMTWPSMALADVQPTNEVRLIALTPVEFDYLGDAVAISSNGTTIAAGAPFRDNIGVAAGIAEIYVYGVSNWSWQASLTDEFQTDANFGDSIAIREDGNRVLVGAPYDNVDVGAAFLYNRIGISWGLTMKLVGSDTAAGDYFGKSVGISGNTAVVGAYYGNVSGSHPGAAYVYLISTGGVVTEQAKLTADDWLPGASMRFGWSVAIQGDTIVVGAPYDDEGASTSGSAYVFERTGTNWMQSAKLTASDPHYYDQFGSDVEIDGDTIVVASYHKNASNYEGAADVFVRDGTNWVHQARLYASDPQYLSYFGYDVDISGDLIVAGAPYAVSGGITNAGETYLFQRVGTNWTETAKFTPSSAIYDDESGWAVTLCGDRVVTVSNNEDVDGAEDAGALYVYDLISGDVFAAPWFTWIAPTNSDEMALWFTTESGASYRVDYRDSLTSGDWTELTNNIPGIGGEVMIIDYGPSAVTSRFYQVVIP